MGKLKRAVFTLVALVCALSCAPAVKAATFAPSPAVPDGTATPCQPGPCSLREALGEADNSAAQTNRIVLAPGTYALTQGALEIDPPAGSAVLVQGQGASASAVTITANGSGGVLDVAGQGAGASVSIYQVQITGGAVAGDAVAGPGGGISVQASGSLVLANSAVDSNAVSSVSGAGGGIFSAGQLDVIDSAVTNNSVSGSDGAAQGAGIEVAAGAATIINSTVAFNSASGSPAQGAGVANSASASIWNSTIAANTLSSGTGAGVATGTGASTQLYNTIIAQNTAAGALSDCAGAPVSNGGNIADDASCELNATDDQAAVDPELVQAGAVPALSSNGGPTATIAVQDDGPAIDHGDPANCVWPIDQRGFGRPDPEDPSPSTCDVGAYEYAALSSTPTLSALSPSAGPLSGKNQVTITGTNFSRAGEQVSAVNFGQTPASSFTVDSPTQITATAPPGAGSAEVSVTASEQVGAFDFTPTSAASAADLYSYLAAPSVSAVSPSAGVTGGDTKVTITGANLSGATAVSFGQTPARSFTVLSPTQITARSPAGAGTVQVSVSAPGGTSAQSPADSFTYGLAPSAVRTGTPSASATGAQFSGALNPGGLQTSVSFQYGLDPGELGQSGPVIYSQATPAQQLGAASTSQTVSASVAGLLPNAVYHVRLVATNSAGTAFGPDRTFTTLKGPAPAPPVLGKSFDAAVQLSGHVFIKLPGAHGAGADTLAVSKGQAFVPLTEARALPSGTQVDARAGTLTLSAAAGKRGKTQTGTFAGALFAVTQSATGPTKGLTTLSLLEGAFPGAPSYASCNAPARASDDPSARAAKLSPKVLQTLRASDNHGNFRTRGRYSAATVRGTDWTISERCDGTLTSVTRGTVLVAVFATRRTVTLHAGQSFLASAPAKRRRS